MSSEGSSWCGNAQKEPFGILSESVYLVASRKFWGCSFVPWGVCADLDLTQSECYVLGISSKNALI